MSKKILLSIFFLFIINLTYSESIYKKGKNYINTGLFYSYKKNTYNLNKSMGIDLTYERSLSNWLGIGINFMIAPDVKDSVDKIFYGEAYIPSGFITIHPLSFTKEENFITKYWDFYFGIKGGISIMPGREHKGDKPSTVIHTIVSIPIGLRLMPNKKSGLYMEYDNNRFSVGASFKLFKIKTK